MTRRNASDFETLQRWAIRSSALTVSTSRTYVDLIVALAITEYYGHTPNYSRVRGSARRSNPLGGNLRACAIRRLVTGGTDLRARFDAELRVAGLQLGERDYELLFAMWAEHLPQREALRATVPGPDEEPLG
jgi:hypothetical protein